MARFRPHRTAQMLVFFEPSAESTVSVPVEVRAIGCSEELSKAWTAARAYGATIHAEASDPDGALCGLELAPAWSGAVKVRQVVLLP